MKELNKLYCMRRESGDFSCSTTPFGGSTEYICKDALLGLINNYQKVAKKYPSMIGEGIKIILETLTDDINSLLQN